MRVDLQVHCWDVAVLSKGVAASGGDIQQFHIRVYSDVRHAAGAGLAEIADRSL